MHVEVACGKSPRARISGCRIAVYELKVDVDVDGGGYWGGGFLTGIVDVDVDVDVDMAMG